ncbi:MAG: hypothetical protein OXC72_07085 [Roseovarius sp.]|nr:hypothetical protein [Roseovarius sp.]
MPDPDKQLYRISRLVGTYNALKILQSKELSNRWMHLPSKNRNIWRKKSASISNPIQCGFAAFAGARKLLGPWWGGYGQHCNIRHPSTEDGQPACLRLGTTLLYALTKPGKIPTQSEWP